MDERREGIDKLNKYGMNHKRKGGMKESGEKMWGEKQQGKCDQGMLTKKSKRHRDRGWSEKKNIAKKAKAEAKVHQRLSCTEAMRGVHLSALRSPRKPPGTETPVNSGNKKMIKSDLMSRRRQAKTHICHRETDVTAPPSHFSLPPSLTLQQSLIHSLHSPISDVFSLSRPIPYTFPNPAP